VVVVALVVVALVVEAVHSPAAEVGIEVEVDVVGVGVAMVAEVVLPGEKVLRMILFSSIRHRRFWLQLTKIKAFEIATVVALWVVVEELVVVVVAVLPPCFVMVVWPVVPP